MIHEDVNAVDEVWLAAFESLREVNSAPPEARSAKEVEIDRMRLDHLVSTDPEGVFVATDNDRIVGLCQSLRRGPLFVLSRLGIRPDFQDLGIGRELLDRALAYGAGAPQQYIFTSRDPRAVHSYVREGFMLRPSVAITGRPRAFPDFALIHEAGVHDLHRADEIDRETRGLSRVVDLAMMQRLGATVLLDDGGGYLVFSGTRLTSLCATTVAVASRLLEAALSGILEYPPLEVGWVVQEQQWAIETAARCGASLAVRGAIMTRGVDTPYVPYLPNGIFG